MQLCFDAFRPAGGTRPDGSPRRVSVSARPTVTGCWPGCCSTARRCLPPPAATTTRPTSSPTRYLAGPGRAAAGPGAGLRVPRQDAGRDGQGDFERAYQQAAAVSPAGVFASHVPACASGRLRPRGGRGPYSPRGGGRPRRGHAPNRPSRHLAAAGPDRDRRGGRCRAPDHQAIDPLRAGARHPRGRDSLFDLARVHLAYGERLRRTGPPRRRAEQLGAALDIFLATWAYPWQARAENELRAACEETSQNWYCRLDRAADPAGVRGGDARRRRDEQTDRGTPRPVPPHRRGGPPLDLAGDLLGRTSRSR